MKPECLRREIDLISDRALRRWTEETLENAPDYFFEAPASSTGRHHPACTHGKGGLVVHVRRAVFVANDLCTAWDVPESEGNIVLAATILHDVAKTSSMAGAHRDYVNHPLNACRYFAPPAGVPGETIAAIEGCIRHHMGPWGPEGTKKPVAEYSMIELMVYTADYIAANRHVVTPVDHEGSPAWCPGES